MANTRTFLIHTALAAAAAGVCIRWVDYPLAFRFFHADLSRGGFPSGRMMIAASLLLAFGRFSPVPRSVWLAAGIALGLALVITNYHFLGDVVAGAYGGFAVDWAVHGLLAKGSEARRQPPFFACKS